MNIENELNGFLLSLHYFLLASQISFIYILSSRFTLNKTPKCNNMLLFDSKGMILLIYTIVLLAFELYFISSFFVETMIYPYEVTAIVGQIILNLAYVYTLKDMKSTNDYIFKLEKEIRELKDEISNKRT